MEEALTLRAEETAKWKMNPRLLALATGTLVMSVLYGVWGYQHWSFAGGRSSVLAGWAKVLPTASDGEWEFCYFVPLLVAFLVYRQVPKLRRLPLAGDWAGAGLILVGIIFYWLGYKVDTGYLGFASLQTVLAGLILLLAGREWWRTLFLAWLFLLFAWPFFPLDSLLAARLKIPTAQAAAMLLRLVGVDTVRDGSVLQSGADLLLGIKQGDKFKLEVSDSCSGMRSIYSLMMVSVLYGIMALKGSTQRWALFSSAIPMAIIGNVARLLMLAFGSLWFGQAFAIGVQNGDHLEESNYHLLCGFAVFGVALGGMFALATSLEGTHWKKIKLFGEGGSLPVKPAKTQDGSSSILIKTCAAFGFSVLGIVLCEMTPEKVVFAEPGLKASLPASVGEYQGVQGGMTAKEEANFDSGVQLDRRTYASPSGRVVSATVVLSGSGKRTLHEPHRCLPDSGWVVTDTEEVNVRLSNGRRLVATVMHVFRDAQQAGKPVRIRGINLYWYEGAKGVSTPSYMMSNFISYRDAIFRNLNHRWGQVSFFLWMQDAGTQELNPMEELMAVDDLKSFVAKAAPNFLTPP